MSVCLSVPFIDAKTMRSQKLKLCPKVGNFPTKNIGYMPLRDLSKKFFEIFDFSPFLSEI